MLLAHEVKGTGPALALVSGLGQVGRRWRRVADLLADEYTVATLDNRETGATGPCPGGFVLPDMGADVLETMSHLGHEQFFLAGISMGGMVSQEVILQAPQRVRAAVLLATHGGTPTSVPPENPGILLQPDPQSTWAALCGPGYAEANPDVIAEEAALSIDAATPPEAYMRQFQAIFGWDPGDALLGVDVPIAVAHGDCDPLVPYENGVNLARRLGVELVTFEGAGHVLESERAKEVAELLRRVFA